MPIGIEEQENDRERRWLPVDQQLLQEAVAPKNALDGGQQLRPRSMTIDHRDLVREVLEFFDVLSGQQVS
jgi:hypothetical protein